MRAVEVPDTGFAGWLDEFVALQDPTTTTNTRPVAIR
jgi:hypothetical protein